MFLMAFENKAGMPIEPATFQLYVPALGALWRDSGIKEAFSRRSEYQLVSTSVSAVGGESSAVQISPQLKDILLRARWSHPVSCL